MSLFQPIWQPAVTTAATIPNTPAGSIAATTVQGAINELDTEKLAIADIDDAPVNGVVNAPISSNWAYDHAALTTAHGISSFGATLVDDATAGDARTTLGLGTAATTASTAYAPAGLSDDTSLAVLHAIALSL